MDAPQIAREVERRRGRSRRRLELYGEASRAFFAAYETPGNDARVQAMIGDARPALRLQGYREWLEGRQGAPNYVPIIVEDFKALRGVIPTMRVRPRQDTDAGRREAEDWTKVLREQWDHSNMDLQQEEAAFYWSLYGECLYILEPVFPAEAAEREIAPGVYLSVHAPEDVFPRMREGWERYDLADVAVVKEMTADEAREQYGWTGSAGDRRVSVVHWYDDRTKRIVVDGQEVFRWDHDLGEVPAVWARAKQHGGAANQSDVVNILGVNRELAQAFLVSSDALVLSTYAERVIINPAAFPEQIATGPGAVIPVHEGGDAKILAPTGNVQPGQMLIDAGIRHMEHVSGASEIRIESGLTGSNISGRAIRNSQGGQEQRLAMSQQNMGRVFQLLNRKILRMLHRLTEFRTDMDVWGERGGASISFNGADLEGWTRTVVEWSAALGTTSHENVVQTLQMHAAGAVPRRAIAAAAGIDDPDASIREADQDKIAQARVDAQAQQAVQGGQQPPDPGQAQDQVQQPAQQAAGMSEGGAMPPQGAAPPPGPPGAPPQFPGFPSLPVPDGALGTPASVPDFDTEVERLLKPVAAQLRGGIVSVLPSPRTPGPPAGSPAPSSSRSSSGVRVVLTDSRDFPLVRKALAPLGKVSVSIQGATTGSNGRAR